jgi:hypothetical protein
MRSVAWKAFARAREATPNRRSTSGDVEGSVDRLSVWQLSAANRHGQRDGRAIRVVSAPFGLFGEAASFGARQHGVGLPSAMPL